MSENAVGGAIIAALFALSLVLSAQCSPENDTRPVDRGGICDQYNPSAC